MLQNDFDNFHPIILHLLNLLLCLLSTFSSPLLPLPCHYAAILQPILLCVVVQAPHQLLTIGNQRLEGWRLFETEVFSQFGCCALAGSIFMDERLGRLDQFQRLSLNLPFQ